MSETAGRMSNAAAAASRLVVADSWNLPNEEWLSRTPHTTLILACYRVERYLPLFLASLDAQTADHAGYELIFVIDGCPEGSERVVREWAARTDYAVRIVVKPNGGVASARNAGLDRARGAWVSSPDPDDRLDPEYLAEIERARQAHPRERMFVGRIRLRDAAGREVTHPLDFKYGAGERRVVDLALEPDDIQTLGGVVFFSAERIAAHRQRVREDLPTASDADFIMRYLLLNGARYVLVPSASYHYQRRPDASSIVKTQEPNIERYTTVFGLTHRSLLDAAGPDCPPWLANTLLYFTSYLFRRHQERDSPVTRVAQPTLDRIREELTENLRRIGAERIGAFRIVAVPLETRMAWLAAAAPEARRAPAELLGVDLRTGSARLGVYVVDPAETFAVDGAPAEVLETRLRRVEYLGSTWLFQRILRVAWREPSALRVTGEGGFEVEFGGEPLTAAAVRQRCRQVPPSAPASADGEGRPSSVPARRRPAMNRLRRAAKRLRFSLPLRFASLTGAIRRDAGAWVCSDADECAPWLPALCRSLAAVPGAPPLRLVVERGADRGALRGLCTVRRGSARHFVLMKRAALLMSTGLSPAERQPFPREVLAQDWRLVHLPAQPPGPHDFRRLNEAAIGTIAAHDADEFAVYTRDRGPYRYLPSEVVLLPGFRGGELGDAAAAEAVAALHACAGQAATG